MSFPDFLTSPCTTPQVVTTDVVSEHVVQTPADIARKMFINSDHLLVVRVAVAAAGMASGIRFQYRAATNAALTGSPITLADSGILLPAVLTANSVHRFRIKPIALPVGYDFFGGWFDLVNEAASGGFAVYWDLTDDADSVDVVDATP